MDKKRRRAFVYNKVNGKMKAKQVYEEETEYWYKKGWEDTPAKFYDFTPFKDEEGEVDDELVGVVLDNIDGIAEAANQALNLDVMAKKELVEYGNKHLGMKLSFGQTADKMREKIRKKMDKK